MPETILIYDNEMPFRYPVDQWRRERRNNNYPILPEREELRGQDIFKEWLKIPLVSIQGQHFNHTILPDQKKKEKSWRQCQNIGDIHSSAYDEEVQIEAASAVSGWESGGRSEELFHITLYRRSMSDMLWLSRRSIGLSDSVISNTYAALLTRSSGTPK